ncbi:glycosyltransferase family 4 protein [Oscillatoriales cyanobacterium LEGE 11467]|uniref:Glycosyltransferase family 4 protein n=1 Tax=Zarconia navalis LEGE 11467 TaxID=1828826 RepID=A0A928VWK9_9CYAN|nr:glycosyltransferase family 4 protein [Zarconia navalis]MBE9039586.1 glycosyltransferase family 4 protein [Zarconia navalis LEGE 11467]
MTQIQKNILFHLPVLLKPIDTGAKRRIFGILEYFKSRSDKFTVDVVAKNNWGKAIWNSEQQQEAQKYFENIFIYRGERNLGDFLYSRSKSFYYKKFLKQQLPIDSDYHTPPGYINFVRDLASRKKYDYIWINYLDYAHLALAKENAKIHKFIDMHDLSCKWRIARKNIPHLKDLRFDYESNFIKEVKMLDRFDIAIANSLDEIDEISPHIPFEKLHLIPHLIEEKNNSIVPYFSRNFKYDLLFVGAAYQPNLTGLQFFISSILPALVAQNSKIKLAIVGTVCQSIKIESSLEKNIDLLGYVPQLSDVYLQSKLVICPLLDGSGTKVKLQEAMAYSIPIVTTTTGASGLNLQDGVNAFITDDSTLYAKRILNLLKRSKLAQEISQAVASTYAEQYSHSAIYSQLDRLFGIVPSCD